MGNAGLPEKLQKAAMKGLQSVLQELTNSV